MVTSWSAGDHQFGASLATGASFATVLAVIFFGQKFIKKSKRTKEPELVLGPNELSSTKTTYVKPSTDRPMSQSVPPTLGPCQFGFC